MEFVEFKVGTKEVVGDIVFEIVKKTYHFVTIRITDESNDADYTIRRKPKYMVKENGWLEPSTFTMGVKWHSSEIYACNFE